MEKERDRDERCYSIFIQLKSHMKMFAKQIKNRTHTKSFHLLEIIPQRYRRLLCNLYNLFTSFLAEIHCVQHTNSVFPKIFVFYYYFSFGKPQKQTTRYLH